MYNEYTDEDHYGNATADRNHSWFAYTHTHTHTRTATTPSHVLKIHINAYSRASVMLRPTRENSSRRSGLGRSQDRVCNIIQWRRYYIILLLQR